MEHDGIEFDEGGERIVYSPVTEIETTMGRLALSWANTRVRLFGLGYEHLQHIEYRDETGLRGLPADDELVDTLVQHDYPSNFDPVPDQASLEWYVDYQKRQLDKELDNM